MTRKDYQLIADAFRHCAIHTETADDEALVLWVAETLAGSLEADNPRFDRTRFLAASRAPNGTLA